jgi:hypothetical protein
MAQRLSTPGEISVGGFFESCNFHPCLCSRLDREGLDVEGISLVDGRVLSCNIRHCGLRRLSLEEAIAWKLNGPTDVDLGAKDRWWK